MTAKEACKKYTVAQFLTNNGLWKKFVNNTLANYSHLHSIEQFLERHPSPEAIISCAFVWGKTEEGIDFWSDLNSKFILYEQKLRSKNLKSEGVNERDGEIPKHLTTS